MNIHEKLSAIQNELKAPKDKYNSFGKYAYRSAEGILEAVKPLCQKYKTTLILSDDIVQVGDRYYVKAEIALCDLETPDAIYANAFAREDAEKKGMDGSQITGACSSYARKYALNGMFNIDDTKDADTDEYHNQTKPPIKVMPKEDPIITKAEAKKMFDMITSKGVALDVALKDYKVDTIGELRKSQFDHLMARLIKTKES